MRIFAALRKPAFCALGLCAATSVWLSAGGANAGVSPNDPYYPQQWPLTTTRTNEAWGATHGAATVKVALLDSGIGYPAPPADFQGQLGPSFNTFTGGTQTLDDVGNYGLGTGNAGVIGADTNNAVDTAGMNWNVTILSVKVCNWAGTCPHDNIAAGIDWAIAQGAQIIQISAASGTTSPTLEQAVARAVAAGRLVVAPVVSAGTGVGYPGLLPGVIAVGATKSTDALATFSGGGSALDIVAPGDSVLVMISGGCCMARSMNGIAASHVTGALALLLAAGVPPSQATNDLLQGAKDLGATGWDASYGWGRLDVCGALNRAGITCPAASGCSDFDGNGWSDLADVIALLGHFGQSGSGLPWDLDRDGGVGAGDAIRLLNCIFP